MNRKTVPIDIAAVGHIMPLAKRAGETYKDLCSGIPAENGLYSLADAAEYFDEPGNEYARVHKKAITELKNHLLSLPLKTVQDLMTLMYLGRNGAFDVINSIPVHWRFRLYRNDKFRGGKDGIIKHMVGKSPVLYKYWKTGLQFMELGVNENDEHGSD